MKTFDLQINGYAGTDFNGPCTTDEIHSACDALNEDGVEGILATVITADLASMTRRIEAIVNACNESQLVRDIVQGIHLEGPFISPAPGYVGAHDKRYVIPAKLDVAARLIDSADGMVKLVTLAPEFDEGLRTTRWIADQGIVVSAGHCDPSCDQLQSAIDNGLEMFTHVGNGCPMKLHRHDNIVQRVLSFADKLWCCFIADGTHVEGFALKNYLRCAGVDRSVIVTDAISASRLGPGAYKLGNWDIEVGPDLVAREPGGEHFVGSTGTMPRSIELLSKLGFNDTEIKSLVYDNPLSALNKV